MVTLLDMVWEDHGLWAIIPFEELDTALEGAARRGDFTALDDDFDADAYGLTVTFGPAKFSEDGQAEIERNRDEGKIDFGGD